MKEGKGRHNTSSGHEVSGGESEQGIARLAGGWGVQVTFMKRALLVCLIALTLLAAAAFWLFATRGVELAIFSHKIGDVLQSSNTTVTGSGFEAAEDTPLPFLVKWNPRFWLLSEEAPRTGLGTGARGEIYYLKHGSAVLECRVRRTREVVEYVEIRCLPQDHSDADLVRSALANAFSGLVVRVRFV